MRHLSKTLTVSLNSFAANLLDLMNPAKLEVLDSMDSISRDSASQVSNVSPLKLEPTSSRFYPLGIFRFYKHINSFGFQCRPGFNNKLKLQYCPVNRFLCGLYHQSFLRKHQRWYPLTFKLY